MKRKVILNWLSYGFVLFVCGCATMPVSMPVSQPLWPSQPPYKWYWYVPEKTASSEQAIGTIKNLQQSFVEYSAGQDFSNFEVDNYGLRANWEWEWTETTETTEWVPSYGGFFIGWNYIPTYGGSYEPRTYVSQQKQKGMFIIPFPEVLQLQIYHYPRLERKYKWGLVVFIKDKGPVALRAADESTVRQLANAIATLSLAHGDKLRRPLFGVSIVPLTQKQLENLGILDGIGALVIDVAINSPAQKSDIRFLDVIREINGQPVKTVGDIFTICANYNKPSIPVKILRRENVTDSTGKISEIKKEHIVELIF